MAAPPDDGSDGSIGQIVHRRAVTLAVGDGLHCLDALHLAAALLLPADELVFATWDRRLHTAARAHGLVVLPDPLA